MLPNIAPQPMALMRHEERRDIKELNGKIGTERGEKLRSTLSKSSVMGTGDDEKKNAKQIKCLALFYNTLPGSAPPIHNQSVPLILRMQPSCLYPSQVGNCKDVGEHGHYKL